MIGNLENIGYFRDTPCIFNIDTMEEVCSVVACGANAISKRYYINDNKIERFANLKNLSEYINRIQEMIDKKNALFD
jgi:oxygen-independent coproporphyrinogen-3 oxidase